MHADAPTCTATKGGRPCILEANHPGAQENTGHRFRAPDPEDERCVRQLDDDEAAICKYCERNKRAYCDECEMEVAVVSMGGDEVRCLSCKDHFLVPKEAVNSPAHYNAGNIEVIEAIQDWKLGFCEGNAVKYIGRAKHKGNELEDLRKAAWYLDYRIRELEQSA